MRGQAWQELLLRKLYHPPLVQRGKTLILMPLPFLKPKKPNTWNQRQGLAGEKLAADYLKKQGYKILKTRYRTRYGEIDIIALKGEVLLFVEVKQRSSDRYGDPLEAVNAYKLKHLNKAATSFLMKNPNFLQKYLIEFAVIAIRPYSSEHRIEMVKLCP